MQVRFCFINDEVGPNLPEQIAFAHEHELSTVELRSVSGRNLIELTDAELREIAVTLRDNRIRVASLASPLLKWWHACSAPAAAVDPRTHGFAALDAAAALDHHANRCLRAAEILGAEGVRVFSYLRDPTLSPSVWREDLLRLSQRFSARGIRLLLENEGVCNVASAAEMEDYFASPPPGIEPLLDLGNLAEIQALPDSLQGFDFVARCRHLHIKDFGGAGWAPVGSGTIPFAELLREIFTRAQGELTLSLETHVKADPAAATTRSLAATRAIVSDLGVGQAMAN